MVHETRITMKTTTALIVFAIVLFCKCIVGGEALSAEGISFFVDETVKIIKHTAFYVKLKV